MTNLYKRNLIQAYSEDYLSRTGEHVKMVPCSKWEAGASMYQHSVDFWKIVKMVFDFTEWTYKDTYSNNKREENVFRRALIDFIAVNNGNNYSSCARLTKRDHTTILHSVTRFENRLETEPHTKKYFEEVILYIKENFHRYEKRNITRQSVI